MAAEISSRIKVGASMRRAALPLSLMLFFPHSGALAEGQKERFPVTPIRILDAMSNHQLPTADVQLKISVPMTTLSADSQLDVLAIAKTGPTSARLRISCHQHEECLPFFVSATWPAGVSFAQPAPEAEQQTGVMHQGRSLEASSLHSADSQSASPRTGPGTKPVILSGSPATLLLEDRKMEIRLHVICLQDGSGGAQIRVETPDRKHKFTAEVVMPGLVRGSF